MSNEPNILEQISAKRRGAEIWLRDAGDYVRDYRVYLQAGRLSGDYAIEAIDILDGLDDAAYSYFEDLVSLLEEASQLSPSQLRRAEPKFSRAKPILSHADGVLDQIAAVHKEIVSFTAALQVSAEEIVKIREEHLVSHPIPGQLPRLCDEVRNALINSEYGPFVEVAEGISGLCFPECRLGSLKGANARIGFTKLEVEELYVRSATGSYYSDLDARRVKSPTLTVRRGRVDTLTGNDVCVTRALTVAVSGIVEHARGNGTIIGPKLTDPAPNGWGRGWLNIREKDPRLNVEGNVQVGGAGQWNLRTPDRQPSKRKLGP
jgi:hypothetical protein